MIDIDIFALNVVTVLGLGLAIDYSLFMVSRYRDELARSGPGLRTMCNTVGPIGRMVSFSAGTVAAAVASLCIFPQPFLYSTGVGCALVAVLSALVVILVLPAILGLLGTRINALSISDPTPVHGSPLWRRVAAVVQARPGLVAFLVTAVMLFAALPLLRIQLTRADARVLPSDNSARLVDSAVRANFRDDPADSILLVQRGPSTFRRWMIKPRPPVTRVDPPRRLPGGVKVVEIHMNVDPNSDGATRVVKSIRDSALGAATLVAGPSAELVDERASLRAHLPLAVTIVVASTLIAILLMTGSAVLAVLTFLVNMLTIGVALGVLVLVFQDNRFESLLVYSGVGALDISVPILLFAVIFGLSTDYGVFLLSAWRRYDERSRVLERSLSRWSERQDHHRGGDPVRGRDRLVRLLPDGLHQGGRRRHRPRCADRRDHRQGLPDAGDARCSERMGVVVTRAGSPGRR